MSRWMTPWAWSTDKACSTARHTEAICSSFILRGEQATVANRAMSRGLRGPSPALGPERDPSPLWESTGDVALLALPPQGVWRRLSAVMEEV